MNELSSEKRAALKRLLAAGASHRAIASEIHCSKPTIARYAKMWTFDVKCGCGRDAGHRGWCRTRLDFSPDRRGWLSKRWGKRRGTELSVIVDQALAATKAQKHRMGRFIWAGAQSVSIAYSICSVCGKQVRVFAPGAQWERYLHWERYSGTAVTDRCKSKSERAAEAAARKEKREWQAARKTFESVKRALRDPSRLHEAASPPAAISPPSSQP